MQVLRFRFESFIPFLCLAAKRLFLLDKCPNKPIGQKADAFQKDDPVSAYEGSMADACLFVKSIVPQLQTIWAHGKNIPTAL